MTDIERARSIAADAHRRDSLYALADDTLAGHRDHEPVVRAALAGIAAERARTAAWLREQGDEDNMTLLWWAAEKIERGVTLG